MTTTNAAPKFLLCILLVAALFTSGAKSDTTDRTAIMDCDENTKHCDIQDCSNFCTVTKHFQAATIEALTMAIDVIPFYTVFKASGIVIWTFSFTLGAHLPFAFNHYCATCCFCNNW
ncbi:uncharacterized protein DS421_12g379220 [Arachis hypogaea]|nr:uncharacterized protein DS421_12g379220 [Arachis hypogaea]